MIVPDRGGVTDLVENGVTGLQFAAEDAAALVARVGLLLRDPALRARLASTALEYARQRAWPRQLALLFAYYHLALRVPRPAPLPLAS